MRELYPRKTIHFQTPFGDRFTVTFPKGLAEIYLKTDSSNRPDYPSPPQHVHLTRDGRVYT